MGRHIRSCKEINRTQGAVVINDKINHIISVEGKQTADYKMKQICGECIAAAEQCDCARQTASIPPNPITENRI